MRISSWWGRKNSHVSNFCIPLWIKETQGGYCSTIKNNNLTADGSSTGKNFEQYF